MDKPVVLITGGLTGIGRATALAFAKKGAKVVVTGRRDEAGGALVKEQRALGAEAEYLNAGVRKEDDVRNMVDKTVARVGRLDVAVNSAATEGAVGPITDQTAESFAATFETNVLGVVLSMKHEVRVMQGQGRGSIFNISSTYGHEGTAFASIYVGAKHAVEGVTKSVALEIAKSGIRVNAVSPGPTDTGMLTASPARRRTRRPSRRRFRWVDSASPRRLPTESCSSHRTKPRSSRATSSTSTAVIVRTDPVRTRGIARGSRRLRPTPDQRAIHLKWKEEVQWLT
jgi:NAD(P)-dependent dehydrogenase (short-subunit alcohol dehydrogenase family)